MRHPEAARGTTFPNLVDLHLRVLIRLFHSDILAVYHSFWLVALDSDDIRDGQFDNLHLFEPDGIFGVFGEEGVSCVWDCGGCSNIFVFDV